MASLIELRDYVKSKGSISLIEMANEFRTPKELLELMMERLVQKGQIETWVPKVMHSPCCSDGKSCGCGGEEKPVRYYRWVE